tara:strand:- start:1458 stop:1793 length:336 start_codon:yes stop_codon:yes gene_type:complete
MAFTRKNISTTSTFSRNGAIVESVAFPSQRVWKSTSDPNTKSWDLGQNWSITTAADSLKIKFQGTNTLALGLGGLSLGSLSLTNFASEPSVSSYSVGDMIKIDGKLFVLEN